MNKIVLSVATVLLSGISTISDATSTGYALMAERSVDWTNYLKSLQLNCNEADAIIGGLAVDGPPKHLRESITKKTGGLEGEYDLGVIDFYLHNATFHGYKISKISVNRGWDEGFITVSFYDDNLKDLLSKFVFGDRYRIEQVGVKNFWILDENDRVKEFAFFQKPKNQDGRDKFGEKYRPKYVYITDEMGGSIETYDEGRGYMDNYLRFEHNSFTCGWALY